MGRLLMTGLLVVCLVGCAPTTLQTVKSASHPSETARPITATVKKKDGQIVEGKVKGIMVQKGQGVREVGEIKNLVELEKGLLKRGATKSTLEDSKYMLSYTLKNGEDIDMISEEGIGVTKGSVVASVIVGMQIPPNDAEILEYIVNNPALFGGGGIKGIASGRFSVGLDEGGRVIKYGRNLNLQLSSTDKLLGELRIEGKKAQLIPALEITTAEGLVTIPVDEIVEFKEKAQG